MFGGRAPVKKMEQCKWAVWQENRQSSDGSNAVSPRKLALLGNYPHTRVLSPRQAPSLIATMRLVSGAQIGPLTATANRKRPVFTWTGSRTVKIGIRGKSTDCRICVSPEGKVAVAHRGDAAIHPHHFC